MKGRPNRFHTLTHWYKLIKSNIMKAHATVSMNRYIILSYPKNNEDILDIFCFVVMMLQKNVSSLKQKMCLLLAGQIQKSIKTKIIQTIGKTFNYFDQTHFINYYVCANIVSPRQNTYHK